MSSCCSEIEVLQEATETTTAKTVQADFSFCLPFGGKVECTDGIITVTKPTAPANGVYDTITISSGCITAVGKQDLATTTASPCAPLPTPCDCDGSGGLTISTQSGNLSKVDSTGGLFTSVNFKAGTGIKITGTGTSSSPITISTTSSTSKVFELESANAAIVITGSGTSSSPYKIKHKENSSTQTINGMSFDKFGHLQSYSAPSSSNMVKGIVGGTGIDANTNTSNGIVTISLAKPATSINKGVLLGGYTVTFDEYNQVLTVAQDINLTAGTYAFGNVDVTVNKYGSITRISGLSSDVLTNTRVVQLTSTASDWSYQFNLGHAAHLLITIDTPGQAGSLSVSSLTIDGTTATGYSCGVNRYVCASAATYAKGDHTLRIRGTIPNHSYITISLVSR